MAYDFTTLSPDDFEMLVADLLGAEFGAQLETFKPGKDDGVDLRHSRLLPGQQLAIVQCKRYDPRNFASLRRSLAQDALKLEELRPARYMVATSVMLSPANKQTLIEILDPWCSGPQDIYGADELNALLRKFPEIERSHFKLWMASTTVLERVLHARIFNLAEATVEAARAQLCRLVVHDGLRRALDTLRDHHHVVIVGNPGIGKTTLARMLLCHYLAEGFEPIVIMNDIGQVWNLIHGKDTSQRKFIVLYDDFLGQLAFDAHRFGKNEDLALREFLQKVRRSPNLRFILTTREYILADARCVHGVFDSLAKNLETCAISLDDYTRTHRARMLFNHLYFSDLPQDRLQKLVNIGAYRTILEHEHFNPRIVEWISNHANSRWMSDEEYLQYVQTEFDDPSEIWDHPFRRQISPAAREILILFWSFHRLISVDDLKSSYLLLHSDEVETEQSQLWMDALRTLHGNFLTTVREPISSDKSRSITLVEFQNTSILEYVHEFVTSQPAWLEHIVGACINFLQVSYLHEMGEQMGNLSPEFWIELNDVEQRLEEAENEVRARVAQPEDRPHYLWYLPNPPSTFRRIETRLKINNHLPVAARTGLRRRLVMPEEWSDFFRTYLAGDFVPYNLLDLFTWLYDESRLPSAVKNEIVATFRDSMRDALESQNEPEPPDIVMLDALADLIQEHGWKLQRAEQNAFARVVLLSAQKSLNSPDPEYLWLEGAIAKIGEVIGVNFQDEWNELQLASHYRPQPPARAPLARTSAPAPEVNKYEESNEEALDIDELFSDLIDR